jgi:hypothetical protein
MTEMQALEEARHRWGRRAQAVAEASTDIAEGHFRVGLYRFWRTKVEGIGRTWEEAFANAVDFRSQSSPVNDPLPGFAHAALPWHLESDCVLDANEQIVARLNDASSEADQKAIGDLIVSAPASHAELMAYKAEITRLKMVVRQMSSLMRALKDKERV